MPIITYRPLTPHEERCVAVEAGCDPRTVRRYLAGDLVVSTLAARIRRAVLALGYADSPGDIPGTARVDTRYRCGR